MTCDVARAATASAASPFTDTTEYASITADSGGSNIMASAYATANCSVGTELRAGTRDPIGNDCCAADRLRTSLGTFAGNSCLSASAELLGGQPDVGREPAIGVTQVARVRPATLLGAANDCAVGTELCADVCDREPSLSRSLCEGAGPLPTSLSASRCEHCPAARV